MKREPLYKADHALGNCIATLSALFDARKFPVTQDRTQQINKIEAECLQRLVAVKQTLQELLKEGKTNEK